jgi:hypothetical protein
MTKSTSPRTCVSPEGQFVYGIHKPSYSVHNLRSNTAISQLGELESGEPLLNKTNFPEANVNVEGADWIFEIPNPFSFRGTTYIDKEWADACCKQPAKIRLTENDPVSLTTILNDDSIPASFIKKLPRPLQLALATTSTDPLDLISLAEISCEFSRDSQNIVQGLVYKDNTPHTPKPLIHDHDLFEAVANNSALPDIYKIIMVIRPGAQGASEIIGEWEKDNDTHVYEYLRRNSYIAGGHYAANMADSALRYSIDQLSLQDITALRHLYYQRTYVRLAELLQLDIEFSQHSLSDLQLEDIRLKIIDAINGSNVEQLATLWGWNFGFDFASSGYRLHASHQQIHQQYAMVPESVITYEGNPHQETGNMKSYSSGDLIKEVIDTYGAYYGRDFFSDYTNALLKNKRMDGRTHLENDLIVWQDSHVILFVPKAQTSQWELQLMTKKGRNEKCPGNIIETDSKYRESLNLGILKAQQALAGRGAKMITTIEYSKRIGQISKFQQPLLYSFLPRLPQSPGAFSEAQLRFINGHYPEDFAMVCRQELRS